MSQIIHSLKYSLGNSLRLLGKYKLYIPILALIDMLFLFVYGFVFSMIFNNKVGAYLFELYNLIIKSPESIQSSLLKRGLFAALRATPEISSIFNKLIIWFLVLAAAAYMIYSVFQGLSWKLSYEMLGRKISYPEFLLGFSLVNLFWFVLYIIYHLTAYLFDLRDTIAKNISSAPAPILSFILWLYLFMFGYFALVSYTLVGKYKPLNIIANSFKLGLKRAGALFPPYLLILFAFLIIINFILALSSRISPALMFIIGVVVVFPAITWARVLFLSS